MERYIIEVILFQGFFLLIYQLLLKKETFFTYNRAYLLVTPVLALIVPFIQIEALKPAAVTQEFFTQLPTIFIGEPINTDTSIRIQDSDGFTINWLAVYLIGMGASLLIWIKKYLKINRFYRFETREKVVPRIIQIPNSDVAFSFLQTIFIGENLDPLSRKQILSHERIHINQRHTWDLLLFEVLRVIFWFNPLIIQFQKHIAVVHEYIADAAVVGVFNHSLIKKRIIMLQKSRSKQAAKIKYLTIVPLILGMLIYVSCVQDEGVQPTNTIVESSNLTGDLPPPPPPPAPVSLEWIERFSSGWNAQTTWSEVRKNLNEKGFQLGEATPERLRLQKAYSNEMGSLIVIASPEDKTYVTKGEYQKIVHTLHKNLGLDTEIEELEEVLLEDVPFAVVERVPTFPGCDSGLSNEERKKCMSKGINQYVSSTFNVGIAKDDNVKTGINRIFVSFKIDKNGNVVNIRSRAPIPALEEEARRVISGLPQMTPGQQDGKPVAVLYSLPITFKVE